MKKTTRFGVTLVLPALALLAACTDADPGGDEAGLDMRSRATGESNERLGNDPAEQNTGEGSVPSAEIEDAPSDN